MVSKNTAVDNLQSRSLQIMQSTMTKVNFKLCKHMLVLSETWSHSFVFLSLKNLRGEVTTFVALQTRQIQRSKTYNRSAHSFPLVVASTFLIVQKSAKTWFEVMKEIEYRCVSTAKRTFICLKQACCTSHAPEMFFPKTEVAVTKDKMK